MSDFKEALEKIRIIAETLPDDDPDKIEMMDIEADYSGLMEWALRKYNEAMAMAGACSELSKTYDERKKRLEVSAERMKEVSGVIMGCANERSYKGIAGTISFRAVPPKVVINDEDMIPARFKRTKVEIDKAELKKALQEGAVEGACLSNGGETLSVRIK